LTVNGEAVAVRLGDRLLVRLPSGAASSMVTAGLAQWAPAATTRPASDWVVIVPDADAGNRWAEITDVADRHVATSTA